MRFVRQRNTCQRLKRGVLLAWDPCSRPRKLVSHGYLNPSARYPRATWLCILARNRDLVPASVMDSFITELERQGKSVAKGMQKKDIIASMQIMIWSRVSLACQEFNRN